MPSTIVRALENLRPGLPVGLGSNYAISDPWASERTKKGGTPRSFQAPKPTLVRHAQDSV